MSKDDREEQFHERKTRTRSPEETGGLAQPDRGQEGPFSGGQGLQAMEFGGSLASGQGQRRGRWRRWAILDGLREGARGATGPTPGGTQERHLSTPAGATTIDPQSRPAGQVSPAR